MDVLDELKAVTRQLPEEANSGQWMRIKRYLNLRIEHLRGRLETATEIRDIGRLQGSISEMRALKAAVEPKEFKKSEAGPDLY